MFSFKKTSLKLSAFVIMTAFMIGLFGLMGDALAQTQKGGKGGSGNDLNEYLTETTGRVNAIPDVIVFVCFVGGVGCVGIGLVKLRDNISEGSQGAPLKEALAYLFIGGALLALPTITNVALETATSTGDAKIINFTDPTI